MGVIRTRLGLPADATAAWPMPQAAIALDARLAAIARASRSVDVQTYLLADDGVGRLMLRALADAALRGVRVRLLVDDIHTAGLDPLLLGLAVHPNVEVRLFNPFANGRSSSIGRLMALAGDFDRLDHRMHNKLFVVDGQVAVVGGRNLADAYFLRGRNSNFLDVDMLLVGAVVPSLSASFDRYWNSEQAYDLHAVADPARRLAFAAQDIRKATFDRRTGGVAAPVPPPHDEFGVEPFSVQLAAGRFRFTPVHESSVLADAPEKMRTTPAAGTETVSRRFVDRLDEARREVVIFSPYFVPNAHMIERLRLLRSQGVPCAS